MSARRGWELPGAPAETVDAPRPREREPMVHPGAVASAPRGWVAGQVANVEHASVTGSSGPEPIVLLRLEQFDARGGRTAVTTVRLRGDRALGFASAGDRVQATGKRKSGYLEALQCTNQTTGAAYRVSRARRIAPIIAACVFLAIFATIAIFAVTTWSSGGGFDHGQAVQQCLDSGAPQSFCNTIP